MEIIIIGALLFLGLLIWATINSRKQVVKDWEYLSYLKNKANVVTTKDQISTLHQEMLTFALKCNNEFINRELRTIDGFLRGLYKNAK